MVISLLYIISIFILIAVFLCLKKTHQKQNLIKWLIISFGLLFCYNSIITFILNLFKIPIYLITLTIVNLINSFIIFLFIKKFGYQKYYFLKIDIFAVIFFIIIIFSISFIRFGFPFNIVYETCDPGTHFWTSKDFFEQSYLLNNVTDKTIVNFETRQFASYVNLGILFKIFSNFIDSFDLYQVYIVFDILMLLLSVLMFYVLISDILKKKNILILILGTLLYTFGYPLNSIIIGFFYLGHAIMIITLLFILYRMFDLKQINSSINLVLLLFASFGLFFTYYFFIPVIFGGIFIYFVYDKINKNNLLNFENLIFIFGVLILPCIFGILYFIVPNIGNSNQNFLTQFSLDGYCYIDIYSSCLLFLPFIIYYICYSIKYTNLKLEFFIYILTLLFLIIMFVFWNFNLVSAYYISKIYYLLSLLNFIILFNLINDFCFDKKIFFVSCIIFVIFCTFIKVSDFQNKFIQTNPIYIINNSFLEKGIYGYNLNKLKNPTIILTYEEMKDLKKLYKSGIRNISSNAIPYVRLWLASYFETNKIDYPENKLYDYIIENYYTNSILNNSIYFYRLDIRQDRYNDIYQELSDKYKIKKYDTFLYVK